MTNDRHSPLWAAPDFSTSSGELHCTLAALLDGSERLALTVAGAARQAHATGGCAPGIMNMQFVYDVPDQEIGTSTTPPSTAHLAASCADHVLSHILYVGDEVLISISGAKSRAALMEWLDVHTEIEWPSSSVRTHFQSSECHSLPYEVLHARLLMVRVPARLRPSGRAITMIVELRNSYIDDC